MNGSGLKDIKNVGYLLALHSINGLGPIRLKTLLEYFRDPKLAWEAKESEIISLGIPKSVVILLQEVRRKLDPERYIAGIAKSGIKWLTLFDEGYPVLLKEIYDPPTVLYYKGEFPKNMERSVAVVGTRKISGYGRLITEKFSSYLSENKVVVVSGLARGVDTLAHQAAVNTSGQTIAVLGGGLNHLFPPENHALAEKITLGLGAVISEFPPDHPALAGNFPARNRIISGLSLGVLVTEAAEDSGSLITAKCALDQGREVFAIPGPITSEYSKGPALLLKQGAKLVTEPVEILESLGIDKFTAAKAALPADLRLTETEKKILDLLRNESQHIDELCRNLQLSISVVSASLIKMEIQGLVKNLGAGSYIKIM